MFQQFGFQQYGFQVGLYIAPVVQPLTYHGRILALIGDMVGARYYPNRFPQEKGAPTWPAIRGTIIGRDNEVDQCGAGETDEENIRVQIDICARTYDECETLFGQVCSALADADFPWIRQPGGFEDWDAEAKVHRITRDWVLYQSSDS